MGSFTFYARAISIALVLLGSSVAQQTPRPKPPRILHEELNESSKTYRIGIEYPKIAGEKSFNDAIRRVVQEKMNTTKLQAEEDASDGSGRAEKMPGSLDGTYHVTITKSGIVSVLLAFTLDDWSSVHPWGELASVNYDLRTHRTLKLADLFVPNSDFLQTISRLSVASLEAEEYADNQQIEKGAAPLQENFKVFTVSDTELTVHFRQYQVAAGAAGEPSVTIPLVKLKAMLLNRY